jgi:hypothetical protein
MTPCAQRVRLAWFDAHLPASWRVLGMDACGGFELETESREERLWLCFHSGASRLAPFERAADALVAYGTSLRKGFPPIALADATWGVRDGVVVIDQWAVGAGLCAATRVHAWADELFLLAYSSTVPTNEACARATLDAIVPVGPRAGGPVERMVRWMRALGPDKGLSLLASADTRDGPDAVRRARLLVGLVPSQPRYWRLLGERLFAVHDYAESLACFEHTRRLEGSLS